jgi:hypothetical protein
VTDVIMIREATEEVEETDDEDRLPELMSTDDEDDEEALLDQVIEAMVSPEEATIEASEASPKEIAPRGSRDGEFTCRSCHLILSRSCLADAKRSICRDCTDQRVRV